MVLEFADILIVSSIPDPAHRVRGNRVTELYLKKTKRDITKHSRTRIMYSRILYNMAQQTKYCADNHKAPDVSLNIINDNFSH